MSETERLMIRLRLADEAHAALARYIDERDLPGPSLYHSTLISLTAERGALQGKINLLAKEQAAAVA